MLCGILHRESSVVETKVFVADVPATSIIPARVKVLEEGLHARQGHELFRLNAWLVLVERGFSNVVRYVYQAGAEVPDLAFI